MQKNHFLLLKKAKNTESAQLWVWVKKFFPLFPQDKHVNKDDIMNSMNEDNPIVCKN